MGDDGEFFECVNHSIDGLKFWIEDGVCGEIIDKGLFFHIYLVVLFGFVSKERFVFVFLVDEIDSFLNIYWFFIFEVIENVLANELVEDNMRKEGKGFVLQELFVFVPALLLKQ